MVGKIVKSAKKVPSPLTKPSLLEEMLGEISSLVVRRTRGGTSGLVRQLDQALIEVLEATSAVVQHSNRVFRKLAASLNDVERAFFKRITNGDWAEMLQLAKKYLGSYKSPRTPDSKEAAVRTLKGFIAEVLFFRSDVYRKALKEARDRAKALKIEGHVVPIRDVFARTVDAAGKVSHEALTDGMLAIKRPDGIWQVLTVFELKSRSNFRDLARGRGKKLKPDAETEGLLDEEIDAWRLFRREGQLSRDFERLSEATVEFNGQQLPGGTLAISKKNTVFMGILPEGKRLSKKSRDAIKREFPTFEQAQHVVRDQTLQGIARELLEILSGP
ncbi:MAG: hypothetical protein RDA78_08640 [Roseibium sp.]|uniref:hypothetical protein n=1 Tax=Roseibium sp. TaxID=1936156 RepID=UPI003D9C6668